MRLAGLYGLASLSGAPLPAADLAVLDLDAADGPFVAAARDPDAPPGEVRRAAFEEDRLLLLGRLDDAAALAAELGSSLADPAALALAALRRWGTEARARMSGEWSLAWWQGAERTLTLGVSDNLRDPLLFARNGDHVAFAPDLRVLAGLGWIHGAIDPEGFAYAVGRAPLRLARNGRTVVRGVTALAAGTWARIDRSGERIADAPTITPAAWSGGFDDAVADLEHMLRGSVRRAIAGRARIGVLLSGGFDSSLLAAIAAEELGAGQSLTCFTSAAPAGSGLPDELAFSRMVADRHGLKVIGVGPPPEPSLYLPGAETFALSGPIPSPRHYLYAAFADAGRHAGIEVMLDGIGGEATITRKIAALGRHNLPGIPRQFARRLLGRVASPDGLFHPRLAGDFVASLPLSVRAFSMPRWPWLPPIGGSLFDPRVQLQQLQEAITAVPGRGYRQAFPFRDRALLRLGAAIPARFVDWRGVPRAIARAMLAGKVPEAIRRRRSGLPISPDYRLRMRRDLPSLQEALPHWRGLGVGAVIDLDWLEAAAKAQAVGGDSSAGADMQLGATAHAAGFIAGWRA
ncbi:MAG: asparagine synthase [Sphingomonas bacterium]|uniref:asparagine synthase-related protein n=1 Tax=Sphingomonas bacterium TaxID=1895847 RepID=UPI00262836F9|nr:asparagine synthetase B family protein [Sphingomonas bacterium]MDB5705512.1 asparagine synthase [Sphingomonas bacterium]